jgi:hypothetical protein
MRQASAQQCRYTERATGSIVVGNPARARSQTRVAFIETLECNSPFPETTLDYLYGFDKHDDP